MVVVKYIGGGHIEWWWLNRMVVVNTMVVVKYNGGGYIECWWF